jgi:hypothetical protein
VGERAVEQRVAQTRPCSLMGPYQVQGKTCAARSSASAPVARSERSRLTSSWQSAVMPLRFRPFGVLGSTLEVFVGLLALRSAFFEDEGDPGCVTTAEVAVGVILICAGSDLLLLPVVRSRRGTTEETRTRRRPPKGSRS